MQRRKRAIVVSAAWAVIGLNYFAHGGISYLSGTAFYTFTPVFGSATGQTTSSDPSLPSSSTLSSASYEISGNASPLGGAGGQAGSSSTGSAAVGYIANSTTASIALKSGTGITQTDPAGGTSYAFSQTRIDFKDATRLAWDATSPGFGPTLTLYGSTSVSGSIGAGGFARLFVNLAFYRNSISGANALGSIELDTGTINTAGAFSRTLTASIPASLSSLSTGTDLLMIGTIQFQADNHLAPTEISMSDFSIGGSHSGALTTYVGPSNGGSWFGQGAWQGNQNSVAEPPDSPGRRAYFPNDQGTDRTMMLSNPVTVGVLELSGSAANVINGSPLTLNNNSGPSMIFLRGDHGPISLSINAPIQVPTAQVEFVNDSAGGLFINQGIATNTAGVTLVKAGPGVLTLGGTINHSGSDGATYEVNAGTLTVNSDMGGGTLSAFESSIKVGSAGVPAQLNLRTSQRIDQLMIGADGSAALDIAGRTAIGVQTLSINTTSPGARGIDVRDDGIALRTTLATPISFVRDLVALGYANGDWNGQGINSSTAAADPANNKAVGYARVSSIGPLVSFLGQTVDSNDIVLRYTFTGDANLDGKVQLDDFTLLAAAFGNTGNWINGDFNFDEIINLDDFTALASTFGQMLPADLPRSSAVPEPAAAMLAPALFALTRRKKL